jgi:hypothetical protein
MRHVPGKTEMEGRTAAVRAPLAALPDAELRQYLAVPIAY